MDRQMIYDNDNTVVKSYDEYRNRAIEIGISSVVVLMGLLAPVMSTWGGVSLWDAFVAICAGKEEAFYFPYMWVAGLVGFFSIISGICYLTGVVKENRGLCIKSALFLCIAVVAILFLFSRPTTFVEQISVGDYFGRNGLLAIGFYIPFVASIVGLTYSTLIEKEVLCRKKSQENDKSLPTRSIESVKNIILYTLITIIAMLNFAIALFAPIVNTGGDTGVSFKDCLFSIGESGVYIFSSPLAWIGIFSVVPSVVLYTGALNRKKKKCIVAMVVSLIGVFIILLYLVNTLGSSHLRVEDLIGENGILGAGVSSPFVGNIVGLILSIFLDS